MATRLVRSGRQEAFDRQVALAGVVVEAQHLGGSAELWQFLSDRGQGRAAGNAHQHAFLRGAAARIFARFLGLDLDHAVEQIGVQIGRNEAGTDALNRMWR